MSHTPGPWQVCKFDFRAVEGPDGRIIADIRAPARENGREDASLIAAAPDLLAVLDAIYREPWDKDANGWCEVNLPPHLAESLCAAIEKAKGEQ